MRLAALTLLVLVAFAANSILNRMALAGGEAGPAAFAAIRVISGALALAVLAHLSKQPLGLMRPRRPLVAAALLLYVLGFSFAYLTLDAGVGALILFGGVQVTMFAGALMLGDRPPSRRWVGMGLGMVGLAWLCWPSGTAAIAPAGAALMAVAAVGWGVYSLMGRGVSTPIGETAGSFLVASPVCLVFWFASGEGLAVSAAGWGLAVLSGVVTSGLGYALWYSVLPRLDRSVAGLAQLAVPVIAVAGGVALLGEDLTSRAVLAGCVVLLGVAFGTYVPSVRSPRADRS